MVKAKFESDVHFGLTFHTEVGEPRDENYFVMVCHFAAKLDNSLS
jgi:hypothetical protein